MHLEAYYADLFSERETIYGMLQDGGLSGIAKAKLMQQLKTMDKLLDDDPRSPTDKDPLARFWEQQLERGEEPNLELTIDDLRKMGELVNDE